MKTSFSASLDELISNCHNTIAEIVKEKARNSIFTPTLSVFSFTFSEPFHARMFQMENITNLIVEPILTIHYYSSGVITLETQEGKVYPMEACLDSDLCELVDYINSLETE